MRPREWNAEFLEELFCARDVPLLNVIKEDKVLCKGCVTVGVVLELLGDWLQKWADQLYPGIMLYIVPKQNCTLWNKPAEGWIKCNVDGTSRKKNLIGLGMVARWDDRGRFLHCKVVSHDAQLQKQRLWDTMKQRRWDSSNLRIWWSDKWNYNFLYYFITLLL